MCTHTKLWTVGEKKSKMGGKTESVSMSGIKFRSASGGLMQEAPGRLTESQTVLGLRTD